MKKLFYSAALAALVMIAGCKKEVENPDWTTDIVGVYSGDDEKITVARVDDKTVDITIATDMGGGSYSQFLRHTSTTMNTKTSFTLNDYDMGSGLTFNGEGTLTGNTITIHSTAWMDGQLLYTLDYVGTK